MGCASPRRTNVRGGDWGGGDGKHVRDTCDGQLAFETGAEDGQEQAYHGGLTRHCIEESAQSRVGEAAVVPVGSTTDLGDGERGQSGEGPERAELSITGEREARAARVMAVVFE